MLEMGSKRAMAKVPSWQPGDIYFDPPPRELACQRTRGLVEWRARAAGRGVPPAVHGKSKSMGKITTDAAAGMTIGAVLVSQRRRGHIKRPVAQPTDWAEFE